MQLSMTLMVPLQGPFCAPWALCSLSLSQQALGPPRQRQLQADLLQPLPAWLCPCPSWAPVEQSQTGPLELLLLHHHLPSLRMASGLCQLPIHPPSLATLQLVKQGWDQHHWSVAVPPQCRRTPKPPCLYLIHTPATASQVPQQAQQPQELVSHPDLHKPQCSGPGSKLWKLQGQRCHHPMLHQALAQLYQIPLGDPEQSLSPWHHKQTSPLSWKAE